MWALKCRIRINLNVARNMFGMTTEVDYHNLREAGPGPRWLMRACDSCQSFIGKLTEPPQRSSAAEEKGLTSNMPPFQGAVKWFQSSLSRRTVEHTGTFAISSLKTNHEYSFRWKARSSNRGRQRYGHLFCSLHSCG